MCGLYPGRLLVEGVVGEGRLGPTLEATFREARGRLEVAGTPLASFRADAPTFTASLVGWAASHRPTSELFNFACAAFASRSRDHRNSGLHET